MSVLLQPSTHRSLGRGLGSLGNVHVELAAWEMQEDMLPFLEELRRQLISLEVMGVSAPTTIHHSPPQPLHPFTVPHKRMHGPCPALLA